MDEQRLFPRFWVQFPIYLLLVPLASALGKGTCVTVDVPREKRDAHA